MFGLCYKCAPCLHCHLPRTVPVPCFGLCFKVLFPLPPWKPASYGPKPLLAAGRLPGKPPASLARRSLVSSRLEPPAGRSPSLPSLPGSLLSSPSYAQPASMFSGSQKTLGRRLLWEAISAKRAHHVRSESPSPRSAYLRSCPGEGTKCRPSQALKECISKKPPHSKADDIRTSPVRWNILSAHLDFPLPLLSPLPEVSLITI